MIVMKTISCLISWEQKDQASVFSAYNFLEGEVIFSVEFVSDVVLVYIGFGAFIPLTRDGNPVVGQHEFYDISETFDQRSPKIDVVALPENAKQFSTGKFVLDCDNNMRQNKTGGQNIPIGMTMSASDCLYTYTELSSNRCHETQWQMNPTTGRFDLDTALVGLEMARRGYRRDMLAGVSELIPAVWRYEELKPEKQTDEVGGLCVQRVNIKADALPVDGDYLVEFCLAVEGKPLRFERIMAVTGENPFDRAGEILHGVGGAIPPDAFYSCQLTLNEAKDIITASFLFTRRASITISITKID